MVLWNAHEAQGSRCDAGLPGAVPMPWKWRMAKKVKSSEMEPNGLLVKRKRPRLQLNDLPVRVDAVLQQHSGVVDKMEVSFSPLHNEHKEHVDKWVKFAIAAKTKQLVFDFLVQHLAKEPYGFPFQLFDATTGSHLQSLKLGSVCLKQPATIKSATLPNKPLEFHSLRHLRLELDFVSLRKRRTDVLDLACLLEAAPFMEMLEIHNSYSAILQMWTDYQLKRYRKYNGELRSLPAHAHPHLKLVNITGFYGQKDQLELALHILRISTTLEAMKIDPRPMVAATTLSLGLEDGICFVEGYKVARKYLLKEDNRGVVDIVKVRRREVENVWPYKLIDPDWLAMVAEDE
ncbi:hypothetical protein PR202_ga06517 [Eleusine coracana subsp. coracana]|uniref:At1g61320/AtMIF1 LRR domain-containing protein n=1 Tax=Eleusine coracana subsp. coracana TaxID=191504 RepID=A0AAV5BV96_ELECO|nr:hypothetical protein PR202_ga06517 [Eleusine coracana subsp. coracana]